MLTKSFSESAKITEKLSQVFRDPKQSNTITNTIQMDMKNIKNSYTQICTSQQMHKGQKTQERSNYLKKTWKRKIRIMKTSRSWEIDG